MLCLTRCSPMDYSLPGFYVHWLFQARILEWVAIPFSKGSSQSRDQTRGSSIVGRFFTIWATRKVPKIWDTSQIYMLSLHQKDHSFREWLNHHRLLVEIWCQSTANEGQREMRNQWVEFRRKGILFKSRQKGCLNCVLQLHINKIMQRTWIFI